MGLGGNLELLPFYFCPLPFNLCPFTFALLPFPFHLRYFPYRQRWSSEFLSQFIDCPQHRGQTDELALQLAFAGEVQQCDAHQYRQDSLAGKHEHGNPRQEQDKPKDILHRQAEPTERRMMILHPSAGITFIEVMGGGV